MVQVRRDDELGESDENAELSVFDRILANFCGPFYALRESLKGLCVFSRQDFEIWTSLWLKINTLIIALVASARKVRTMWLSENW